MFICLREIRNRCVQGVQASVMNETLLPVSITQRTVDRYTPPQYTSTSAVDSSTCVLRRLRVEGALDDAFA